MTQRVREVLTRCGLYRLSSQDSQPGGLMDAADRFLRLLKANLRGADPSSKMAARSAVIDHFKELKIQAPARLTDSYLEPLRRSSRRAAEQADAPTARDPAPWEEEVDGEALLKEIKEWFGGYVHAPDDALVATTLWAVSTWFVDKVYFAPILTLLSPTKRSGKTTILELLRWICRRADLTSGVGITSAVVFRLNNERRPTFLIDEAESLSGRNANQDIINLLNQGHRRGATIHRCREVGGGYEVEDFDAFGFRALAAIGSLWDTILDRSVVIRLQRKPKKVEKRRLNGIDVETEGKELGRKLCRFSLDYSEPFEELLSSTPRPEWLNDRACDNWAALFAVAMLAGDAWLNRAQEAAKSLSRAGEDLDWYERLIHDTRRIFKEKRNPEVIPSGELAACLNKIETSPWGEYRGKGLTTHSLASRYEPFKIKPRQNRPSGGPKVRGYWLKDLQPVFRGYPPPTGLGQMGQPSNDGGSSVSGSGTKAESGTSSKPAQTLAVPGMYQLSHFEGGQEKGNPKDTQRSYDRKKLELSPIVVDLIDSMKRADVSVWLDGNGELQMKGKLNRKLRQDILAHALVLTSLIKSGDLVRLTAEPYWEEK